MQLPLQITFRNLDASEAVEAKIRARAEELDHYFDRITGCRVAVEAVNRRNLKGKLYKIRVDLTVPGAEIVVNHVPSEGHSHEDIYVAVRDAFDAARRRLEDYVRRRRGETKTHAVP
ncbi:MAG TPA: HPF/RaiA family ribosome-associated protein [Stellaceae bacterium]|nr:HPF/RaiA family ribosome-associated protein [Stellaceae bacterium]